MKVESNCFLVLVALGVFASAPFSAASSELGTLGGNLCVAIDVNDTGAAVGQCRTTDGDFAPTYWAVTGVTAMALPGLEVDGPCSTVGISGNGVIAGNCELGDNGEPFPVRWLTPSLPSTAPQLLNASTGHDRAEAQFINAFGTVAGTSTDPDGTDHPVLWKSGQTAATSLPVPGLLPPLLSSVTECHVAALADTPSPAVTGYCELRHGGAIAVKWTPNSAGGYSVASLPRISGGSNCTAAGINRDGYVGGTCEDADGDLAAVRWPPSGGSPAVLYGLPRESANGQQLIATAINSAGAIVGRFVTSDGKYRSFVWAPTGDPATEDGLDLGDLGGAVVVAQRIANNGGVIGIAENGRGAQAGFYWSATGSMQDLGTLGGATNHPVAISPNGEWIVGTSPISTGQRHAYRLGISRSGLTQSLMHEPRKNAQVAAGVSGCAGGHRFVSYKRGSPDGFCWKGSGDEGTPSFYALAIAIAGLVILL